MQYFSLNFSSDATFTASPFWNMKCVKYLQLAALLSVYIFSLINQYSHFLSLSICHIYGFFAADNWCFWLQQFAGDCHMTRWVQRDPKQVPTLINVCIFDTVSYLAISDVLAVDLEELLCEGLFLLGGGWHHSGLAQGREHWRVNAFWSGGAIRVLEVGWAGVWTVISRG